MGQFGSNEMEQYTKIFQNSLDHYEDCERILTKKNKWQEEKKGEMNPITQDHSCIGSRITLAEKKNFGNNKRINTESDATSPVKNFKNFQFTECKSRTKLAFRN